MMISFYLIVDATEINKKFYYLATVKKINFQQEARDKCMQYNGSDTMIKKMSFWLQTFLLQVPQ